MASKKPQNTGKESENGDGLKSPSKTKKMTPEEQSAQFIKTARELECDENEEAFEKVMKSVGLTQANKP